jgi:hypothetical protein
MPCTYDLWNPLLRKIDISLSPFTSKLFGIFLLAARARKPSIKAGERHERKLARMARSPRPLLLSRRTTSW